MTFKLFIIYFQLWKLLKGRMPLLKQCQPVLYYLFSSNNKPRNTKAQRLNIIPCKYLAETRSETRVILFISVYLASILQKVSKYPSDEQVVE